ncbi:MAG: glutaminyl-peptide cyclotransferase, partial [Candidatus Sericytochromatia bacterium]
MIESEIKNIYKNSNLNIIKRFIYFLFYILLSLNILSCQNNINKSTIKTNTLIIDKDITKSTEEESKEINYKVINTYPHDKNAFTQGLVVEGNYFYESTGFFDKSSVRKVEISTGNVVKEVKLDKNDFGEGLTIYKNTLIQLTWLSNKVFIYDKDTLEKIKEIPLKIIGWGLTFDSKNLIASDGSSKLYFFNPDTFELLKEITVRDKDKEIKNINELEFIEGEIYANIFKTNLIAKINPETGIIKEYI